MVKAKSQNQLIHSIPSATALDPVESYLVDQEIDFSRTELSVSFSQKLTRTELIQINMLLQTAPGYELFINDQGNASIYYTPSRGPGKPCKGCGF